MVETVAPQSLFHGDVHAMQSRAAYCRRHLYERVREPLPRSAERDARPCVVHFRGRVSAAEARGVSVIVRSGKLRSPSPSQSRFRRVVGVSVVRRECAAGVDGEAIVQRGIHATRSRIMQFVDTTTFAFGAGHEVLDARNHSEREAGDVDGDVEHDFLAAQNVTAPKGAVDFAVSSVDAAERNVPGSEWKVRSD